MTGTWSFNARTIQVDWRAEGWDGSEPINALLPGSMVQSGRNGECLAIIVHSALRSLGGTNLRQCAARAASPKGGAAGETLRASTTGILTGSSSSADTDLTSARRHREGVKGDGGKEAAADEAGTADDARDMGKKKKEKRLCPLRAAAGCSPVRRFLAVGLTRSLRMAAMPLSCVRFWRRCGVRLAAAI